jgi:hypothetical protein
VYTIGGHSTAEIKFLIPLRFAPHKAWNFIDFGPEQKKISKSYLCAPIVASLYIWGLIVNSLVSRDITLEKGDCQMRRREERESGEQAKDKLPIRLFAAAEGRV